MFPPPPPPQQQIEILHHASQLTIKSQQTRARSCSLSLSPLLVFEFVPNQFHIRHRWFRTRTRPKERNGMHSTGWYEDGNKEGYSHGDNTVELIVEFGKE